MGGDRPEKDDAGRDYAPVVRAMAAGIRAGVGGPVLMSYHPAGRRGSAEVFHQDAWLDVNMWQSGHRSQDMPNWTMIAADRARTPAKPVLDGEPCYEDHPINPWPVWTPEKGYFRDYDVRKAAYRSVFAGACGVTYGHHSIWQYYDPARRAPVNHPWCSWQDALDRPGAFQVGYLRRLVEAYPFGAALPDDEIFLSPIGEGPERACALRGADGSFLLVYLPTARAVRLNLARLGRACLRASWFDPRTAQTRPIGELAAQPDMQFTPPAEGPDWVLVVTAA
jgi:hypothetical protein